MLCVCGSCLPVDTLGFFPEKLSHAGILVHETLLLAAEPIGLPL